MHANAIGLVLAGVLAALAVGCFNPQAPRSAAMTPAEEDSDEDDCLDELDAMCACAEAAGTPCTIDQRNDYEDACGDPALRSDVSDCIDEALVCEDAVTACMA